MLNLGSDIVDIPESQKKSAETIFRNIVEIVSEVDAVPEEELSKDDLLADFFGIQAEGEVTEQK
jgi:hypothetical protein